MHADKLIETRTVDDTLTGGLARIAGIEDRELTAFDGAVGRSDVETAVIALVGALGGSAEYAESTDGASEQHLTFARVHVALRRDAWNLASQVSALAVSLSAHNPAAAVAAIGMLHAVTSSVTIMTPDEKRAISLIAENQRKGIPTSAVDLGTDIGRLLEREVLVDRGGHLEIRF